MSQDDKSEGLDQNLDMDSNIVEETQEPNELPVYKNREEAFDSLRKAPETTYADNNHKWVDIEIPESGVLGEKYKIKVSKKVPKLQFSLSNNIKFEVVDKLYRPDEPAQLFGIPLLIEELIDTDTYEGVWEEISLAGGKEFNSLPEGEYLFAVQANAKGSWQQTTVRRIIKLEKK